MQFLIDAQLPPALAKFLVADGIEAKHVQFLGMLDAGDGEIWEYALRNGYVIITKDDDFVKRGRQSKRAPAIVWLRVGNVSKKALIAWFMPLVPEILRYLDEGEKFIEIR